MADRVRVHLTGLAAGERALDDAATKYLVRVHRLEPGDCFVAFDPEARQEADGEVVDARGKQARVRLMEPRQAAASSLLEVTLLQAFGKADKIDRVVRDATALGVRRIVVVATERSVVRIEEASRAEAKRRRWRTIAVESARQSGRGDLPELGGPISLDAALALAPSGKKLCLDAAASEPLSGALSGWRREQPLALLIGPEGGLAADELALAERHGFSRVRLGPLVLRTETAAIAALGALVAFANG
jgi:16S rRNA (uracil1498-N3)-methyltransferase